MSKAPLSEYNNAAVVEAKPLATVKSASRRRSSERKQSTETVHRLAAARVTSDQTGALNIDAKENVDLALEINITTGPNVQVNKSIILLAFLVWRFFDLSNYHGLGTG